MPAVEGARPGPGTLAAGASGVVLLVSLFMPWYEEMLAVPGVGSAEESRSAFLTDGMQVVRGRASKWGMDRTETVTVWPDGHADRGLPPDRPDLVAVEARLRQPLAIRFRPLPRPPD